MKVTATRVGYDGKLIRQPGEVFDMPDGLTATWFEPVKPADEPVQTVNPHRKGAKDARIDSPRPIRGEGQG